MPSLDLEREEMSPWYQDKPAARLSSSEQYEGIAPGFCPQGGCVGPAPSRRWTERRSTTRDPSGSSAAEESEERGAASWASREEHSTGSTQRFLARVRTGRTVQRTAGGLAAGDRPGPAYVMSPNQTIFCMLPIDSAIAKPNGNCPRPGVG